MNRRPECSRIHAGPFGAGPFGAGRCVNRVHPGMDYGTGQAYAESLDLLRNGDSMDSPDDELCIPARAHGI